MGDKTDYDRIYDQYLEERRIYLSDDVKKALRDNLMNLKFRLEAFGNANIPDFEKDDDSQ